MNLIMVLLSILCGYGKKGAKQTTKLDGATQYYSSQSPGGSHQSSHLCEDISIPYPAPANDAWQSGEKEAVANS